mgnify:CR=1 FL=1
MAKHRRFTDHWSFTISRALERVAIAALAAIATGRETEGVVLTAFTIFIVMAAFEESGRYWIRHRQGGTFLSVVKSFVARIRLRRNGVGSGPAPGKPSTRVRARRRKKISGKKNGGGK